MKKITFKFKDYTSIEISIDENDIDNLNTIFSYLDMGAKVFCTSDTEYFMDMSFEERPTTLLEWIKTKWFLIKHRILNNEN